MTKSLMAITIRRHDLIRIDPAIWSAELSLHDALRHEPLLADWAATWPMVARRRNAADRSGSIAVGLPLPPARGKRRLAFDFPAAAIKAVEPPPPLASVRAIAPAVWHPAIDALLALADEVAIVPSVFGSFAWASLTGLDYIHPTSDLDCLWPLGPGIETVLSRLPSIEKTAPGRLDGEIIRQADGGAVNWRELSSAHEVLVKTIDAIKLENKDRFLNGA